MQILFTILAVLGWTLLGIVSLLLLLLVLPVRVRAVYRQGAWRVKATLLFIPFILVPQSESRLLRGRTGKKKPEKQPQTEEKQPEQQKQKKRKLTLDTVLTAVSSAAGTVKLALKGIWVCKINLFYPIYRADAADCAVAYGKTNAYLGAAVAVLENAVHLRFQNVQLCADYQNQYDGQEFFSCKITACPFIMIIAGLYLAKGLADAEIL